VADFSELITEGTHQRYYLTSQEDNAAEMMECNPHPIPLDQSA
jgi:hypothetical protein